MINEKGLKKGIILGKEEGTKGRDGNRVVMQVFYIDIPIKQWPSTKQFSKTNLIFLGGTSYPNTAVKLHYKYTVYSILHTIHYYT